MSDETHHERELGGQLLAAVSRSFYLTLKALPKELREPISLAYLLARTADTIADTASVDVAVRLDCLEQYRALVSDGGESQNLAQMLREQFCPKQSDEAERRLMEKFADGIAWLRTMAPRPLAAIQSVLEHIIDGQMLDIRRFPSDGKLRRLANDTELDDYTWLVAGCVGEFWTQLCASELPSSLAWAKVSNSSTSFATSARTPAMAAATCRASRSSFKPSGSAGCKPASSIWRVA